LYAEELWRGACGMQTGSYVSGIAELQPIGLSQITGFFISEGAISCKNAECAKKLSRYPSKS